MKLFSTNRNARGRQLVCEDAVFDPNLIMTLRVDVEEKVVSFSYDFSECGHPLNLPFDVQSVDFLVKFTKHDIHICAIAEACDGIDEQYEDYINDMQDIEFDVRMTVEEKYALLLALFISLFSKAKTKEKTPNKKTGSATSDTINKETTPSEEKVITDALSALFPNIFNGNTMKGK